MREGSQVKKRRKQLGWSQSDLARAMGSSPSRICKMEASDDSVSRHLVLKALEVMGARVEVRLPSGDPYLDPTLTREQLRHFSTRLLCRRRAERIAEDDPTVDVGDIEHVLLNLTLKPSQRLAESFRRAGLRRLSSHQH
jgi:transcriptional regulator with XRE-family HTH domain